MTTGDQQTVDLNEVTEDGKIRTKSQSWRVLIVILTAAGLFLAINQTFRLGLLASLDYPTAYLFALFACFLSLVFIVLPATKGARGSSIRWYDILLFGLTFCTTAFLASKAFEASQRGWDVQAPPYIVIIAGVFCLLVLEALRRAGGLVLFLITIVVASYPTFAGYMPGLFHGHQFSLQDAILFHALSYESLLGDVSRTYGNLLVGFLFFGAVFLRSGAGSAFINVAFALMGAYKGGAAKVGIVASAAYGTMSGSVVSNIITTGSFTIPAMKKTGYSPEFAAGVEAVASTGGNIMPPVMGISAFIMAEILGISYFRVCVAAIVPALLYYFALYMQVHAYAETHNLKGLERSQIPSLKGSLKEVWPYLFAILLLVIFLYLGLEGRSPFVASVAMIILGVMRKKEIRLHLKHYFFNILLDTAKDLVTMGGLLIGVGYFIGAFSGTGLGNALAHEVVVLAGGNIPIMIILTAVAAAILGTGLPVVACYIFLAVTVVPALLAAGFMPLASHLFLYYWGLSACLTPPVALGSYTAATIAKADFLKTSFHAMRLGILVYLVPFCFIYSPALLLQAPLNQIVLPLSTIILGVVLIAAGLEGYLLAFGTFPKLFRIPFFISGCLLAFPSWQSDLVGIGIFIIIMPLLFAIRRRAPGYATRQQRT